MPEQPLFLFYEEPDPDRWLPGDRYPRRLIRRLLRGAHRPGGVMRWFLNLRAGLDQLGVAYRLNDYRGLCRHPGAVAHVVGKPQVISRIPPGHPIMYGPGVSAHPYQDDFWARPDFALILLSCPWFQHMYDRDLPRPIPTAVWPAGIATELWVPPPQPDHNRILLYDKIRWQRDHYEPGLLRPIRDSLQREGYTVEYFQYGTYLEEDYQAALQRVGAMVFLCEHETQGFAYLQALSCDVPILAWDRGGDWRDPAMYPHRVRFGPVSSVPYWEDRCGLRFGDITEFDRCLPEFTISVKAGKFDPRSYVVDNFNLADRARAYLGLSDDVQRTNRT